MKRLRLCSIVGVFVMVMALIVGCGTSTVSVADVTYKDMPLQIQNDANVTALNKATITSTITGPVVYAVKVGDVVTQGQLLATIDTSALQQQLASLQGQLSQAQVDVPAVVTQSAPTVDSAQLERARQMREAGNITEKEYNRILERAQPQVVTSGGGGANTALIASLEVQIAQVQAQMAAATITAPMDGVVTAIYNEDRQMAIAERPLMLIQQNTPMVASLSIPRDAAMKLAEPAAKPTIKVSLHVNNTDIPGELTCVDTNQPDNVPSVLVKATFNNDNNAIKAGEFYSLTIASEARAQMLVVPADAVRESPDGKFVYVLTENSTVDVRVVETGEAQDGVVAIMNGLNEGEKVITTKGTFELGETVKVA
ncbi:efflux RND transporter periplasmic adaptor subunit [Veillonella agrestimuris]|uniref:efflux RND transporter periplasmic adaptor subunit n=1 Tax=Veillonella agrestimuris TaxID=2941340 RepID=UPI00203CA3F9|nr:efflux RND transporter periplasmic adaptor subunit [Veillonella agrestimuris]